MFSPPNYAKIKKKRGVSMSRIYELIDEEWSRIESLLPPENTGKPGRPKKDNRTMLNAMVWLARSGAPWRDLPERYGPWETVYSRFRKWMEDGILDNLFRVLSLEASRLSSCNSASRLSTRKILSRKPSSIHLRNRL